MTPSQLLAVPLFVFVSVAVSFKFGTLDSNFNNYKLRMLNSAHFTMKASD